MECQICFSVDEVVKLLRQLRSRLLLLPPRIAKLRLRVRAVCHNRLTCVDADVYYCTEFSRCLEAADVQTCNWFLEQLKAVS